MKNALNLILSFTLITLGGCVTAGKNNDQEDIYDPFEKLNRHVLDFNLSLDKHLIRPIAVKYRKITPPPIRNGLRNFFNNLSEPTTIINQALQAKFEPALLESWRFIFNTTIGVFGFMDVASKIGLPKHDEDFGQTFAVWGLDAGPYLVLPILGASTLREGVGLLPQYTYTDPVYYLNDTPLELGLVAVDFTSKRADLIGADQMLNLSSDPYLLIRSAYYQTRNNLIYDGNPPLNDLYNEN